MSATPNSTPYYAPADEQAIGLPYARERHPRRSILSLRGLSAELIIIIAWVAVTRIGYLYAAKWGIQIGPVPLFLTDITLLLLLLLTFFRQPARLLFWLSSGVGAGSIGFAVWILCLLDAVYFIVAFPAYQIYAVRDLAIFGYSLFFPLTYFAIRDHADAIKVIRCLVYAGVSLAVLVFLNVLTGFDFFKIVDSGTRLYLGTVTETSGGGDAAGIMAVSLAALLAYLQVRRHRVLVGMCVLICFIGLAAIPSRASIVGLVLASLLTFLFVSPRYRIGMLLIAVVSVGSVIISASMPHNTPILGRLQNLYVAIASAAGGPSIDPTSEFRMQRWSYGFGLWLSSPVYGVGFGRLLLPYSMDTQQFEVGYFNAGMPHNTFLFLLDRMGIIGLGLIVFCWISAISKALKAFRQTRSADQLASANILVAMAGFAAFVLFFERPMSNAAFWIALAAAMRLVDNNSQVIGSQSPA